MVILNLLIFQNCFNNCSLSLNLKLRLILLVLKPVDKKIDCFRDITGTKLFKLDSLLKAFLV